MQLSEKLKILSGSAKYDVSCASGGAVRRNAAGKAELMPGICHSWSSDGRCVSLLKVLLTNHCIYDCRYCMNRRSNDVERTAFTPEELAQLTSSFYMRNYIEGLFLSSGVIQSPDHTMGLMLRVVRLLRGQYAFKGYIHLKIIPGSSAVLVNEAARLADRVSVNMEFATSESLQVMAPDKRWEAVMTPLAQASRQIEANLQRRQEHPGSSTEFMATGQSTQLIVGATGEDDARILSLAGTLYKKEKLRRVYYSAYVPVNTSADAPSERPPLMREHRLYQADWLLRFYGFGVREIIDTKGGMLDLLLDPKTGWALRNLDRFPVEVERAPLEELLRVPGVGVRGAQRIVAARRQGHLRPEDLARLHVVFKRAKHFLTVGGTYLGGGTLNAARIRRAILPVAAREPFEKQLTFLDPLDTSEERLSAVTGEL